MQQSYRITEHFLSVVNQNPWKGNREKGKTGNKVIAK